MPTGEAADTAARTVARSEDARIAPPPRLFILSDVRLLCEGLALALSQQGSVIVLGSSDFSISPARLVQLGPDVLLLDFTTSAALDFALPLRQAVPDAKVVALSVAEVEQDVIACARAGVCGFVSRHGSTQDVVAAVHSAVRGELLCSPRTAALLFSRMAALSSKPDQMADAALTPREHEIVSLLNDGLSNKEIARALHIQNATVKNHVHSILGKLRVRRRGEAAAQLRKLGLDGSGPSYRVSLVDRRRYKKHWRDLDQTN